VPSFIFRKLAESIAAGRDSWTGYFIRGPRNLVTGSPSRKGNVFQRVLDLQAELQSIGHFGMAASIPATRQMVAPRAVTTLRQCLRLSCGNSLVAVIAFGNNVWARAVTASAESRNLASPHGNDEMGRYSARNLRKVYFKRSQLQGHTEREYHPGNCAAPKPKVPEREGCGRGGGSVCCAAWANALSG